VKVLPRGSSLQLTAAFETGRVRVSGKGLVAESEAFTLAAPTVTIGKRRYPHKLSIRLEGTGLQLVNELDIEQYLEGVLPGELPRGFGIEAQKALAVAARSYALVQSGKHGDFDLCDRTCCQMYLGDHKGSARGLAAVRATRRECLWSGEDLVYAFYSADCGGESTSVTEVPLRDKPEEALPYLRPVKDAPPSGPDYCSTSPFHRWVRRYTREELEAKLNARPATEVGTLLGLEVTDVDPSGRVRTVVIRGETAPETPAQAGGDTAATAAPTVPVEKTVTGWELRRSVGAVALKSTLMTLDQPAPDVYRFTGSGFGHGLGLCQIGANGMAKQGRTYREILAHYYPGTRLARLGKQVSERH
jgi:stage II sporulation protein D